MIVYVLTLLIVYPLGVSQWREITVPYATHSDCASVGWTLVITGAWGAVDYDCVRTNAF